VLIPGGSPIVMLVVDGYASVAMGARARPLKVNDRSKVMLDVAVDVVVDVVVGLWPTRKKRIPAGSSTGTLAVRLGKPGALTRALNESCWLADEVVAAGALRQGKPPSLLTAVTGVALIELTRRRSKLLPREFVLAATAERVVALALTAEGDETSMPLIKIKHGERGCWPRELVRSIATTGPLTRGATLEVAGERIPVTTDADDSTAELIELLSR
jgi:hypothetical protein